MAEINTSDVARYYIECELDNVVSGDNVRINEESYAADLPRLLEALSFTYRLNGVYDYVESHQVRWEERHVNPNDITLTGMGEGLTELIYSDEIGQNPLRMAHYIKDHPEDARFAELTAKEVPQNRRTILLRQDHDRLLLLDGSHRFLSMVMMGETAVNAYIAVPVETDSKPRIGAATILRLRRLWQQTDDPEFRSAIEQTTAGILRETDDGYQSVFSYWVAMGSSDEMRATGQRLLDQNQDSSAQSDLFKEPDL